MSYIEQGKEAVQNLLMMLHTSENWKKEKLEVFSIVFFHQILLFHILGLLATFISSVFSEYISISRLTFLK